MAMTKSSTQTRNPLINLKKKKVFPLMTVIFKDKQVTFFFSQYFRLHTYVICKYLQNRPLQ